MLGWGAQQGFEGLWVLWDHEVGMGFVGPPKPTMGHGLSLHGTCFRSGLGVSSAPSQTLG